MGLRGVCNCMCACMLCSNSSHTHRHIHTCRIKYFIWITTQHSWKHNFSLLHIPYAGCLYTSVIITLFKCNFILTTLGCCISLFLLFFAQGCVRTLYLFDWDLIFCSHTLLVLYRFFSSIRLRFSISFSLSLSLSSSLSTTNKGFIQNEFWCRWLHRLQWQKILRVH